jgi:hypothetical protein
VTRDIGLGESHSEGVMQFVPVVFIFLTALVDLAIEDLMLGATFTGANLPTTDSTWIVLGSIPPSCVPSKLKAV